MLLYLIDVSLYNNTELSPIGSSGGKPLARRPAVPEGGGLRPLIAGGVCRVHLEEVAARLRSQLLGLALGLGFFCS